MPPVALDFANPWPQSSNNLRPPPSLAPLLSYRQDSIALSPCSLPSCLPPRTNCFISGGQATPDGRVYLQSSHSLPPRTNSHSSPPITSSTFSGSLLNFRPSLLSAPDNLLQSSCVSTLITPDGSLQSSHSLQPITSNCSSRNLPSSPRITTSSCFQNSSSLTLIQPPFPAASFPSQSSRSTTPIVDGSSQSFGFSQLVTADGSSQKCRSSPRTAFNGPIRNSCSSPSIRSSFPTGLFQSQEIRSATPIQSTGKGQSAATSQSTLASSFCSTTPSKYSGTSTVPTVHNDLSGERALRREVTSFGGTTVWYESCSPNPISHPPLKSSTQPGTLFVHFHRGGHQTWLQDANGSWVSAFENQRHPLDSRLILHIRPSAEPLWRKSG